MGHLLLTYLYLTAYVIFIYVSTPSSSSSSSRQRPHATSHTHFLPFGACVHFKLLCAVDPCSCSTVSSDEQLPIFPRKVVQSKRRYHPRSNTVVRNSNYAMCYSSFFVIFLDMIVSNLLWFVASSFAQNKCHSVLFSGPTWRARSSSTMLRYFGSHFFYENRVHAAAKMRLQAMEPPVPLMHVR
jgi:hypothetical protein